jgi:hypothetical protein
LRFEPLPPPTTADIEELTLTIARRLMKHLATVWEAEGSDYLDPSLASLAEAFFFSRDPPVTRRDVASLSGMEGQGGEDAGLRGKPLCASVEGFSLHAAQAVAPQDREALERLLRYGLRAPFAQQRLSLREDGKVLYRLRRPWPNERGATHLVLDPLDLLRRLAALISFPYAHQVRYHGLFANRSRMRPRLPSPPRRVDEFMIEAVPAPSVTAAVGGQAERSASRSRTPWPRPVTRPGSRL